MRVLFVCLGNICRSPAAEGITRALAPDLEVDSAGTGGWHVGDPPYGPMQQAAAARGIDLGALRARRFTARDFDNFDLIIAMDSQNLRDIETLRPRGHKTPARKLDTRDVPDPYYTGDFVGCLEMLDASIRALLPDIQSLSDR